MGAGAGEVDLGAGEVDLGGALRWVRWTCALRSATCTRLALTLTALR